MIHVHGHYTDTKQYHNTLFVCYLQRFLPSEFGLDPARMGDALEPGRVTFVDKMSVRKAIEEANIPFTYISANLFAGYFAGSLSQMGSFVPPRDKVHLFGDGTLKGQYQSFNK